MSILIDELHAVIRGQVKLARMLVDQQKVAGSPRQRKEVAQLRDAITSKLAEAGLIEEIDAPAFRESLDEIGGAEHLVSQLLDHFGGSKQASFESRQDVGLGTVSQRGLSGRSVSVTPDGRTYQPLYSY